MTGLRRLPVHTIILLGVALVMFTITSTSETRFYLLVADAQSTAPWRWLTAHLVHTDSRHLMLNLLALTILGALLENHGRCALWLGIMVGCVTVQIWFELQQGITYYCGLSGVLCTLLALVLTLGYQPEHHWKDLGSGNSIIAVAGALTLLKLLVEYLSEVRLTSGMAWPSAPEAHLTGFLSGLIAGVAYRSLLSNHEPTHSHSISHSVRGSTVSGGDQAKTHR